MKLKTIVADDEPLARERLKLLLSHDDEVEVVAECRNGKETIARLKSSPADLLFLDIQMPASEASTSSTPWVSLTCPQPSS